MASLDEIQAALGERGLALRGAFHPVPEDGVTPFGDGRPVATLVLAGQIGASHWEAFTRARRVEPDPLDRWAARMLAEIAERFGARVILPGDGPPHPPFLRWARRAEPVHPSPLGLLIHPRYGLWHAYRGALGLAEVIAVPDRVEVEHPCERCADRPCLRTCPVGAFGVSGFDAGACAAHLESSARGDACFTVACLARAACPVGRAYRYPPEPARFHLTAFLSGIRRRHDSRNAE